MTSTPPPAPDDSRHESVVPADATTRTLPADGTQPARGDAPTLPGDSSAGRPPGLASSDDVTLDAPTSSLAPRTSGIRRLGEYDLLGELGRGGMGVVYKARHRTLGRVVALKMILAGSHASSDQLTRFLAEARAVAHLQHPHIAQIFEIGEHEGLPYFSLEFVDGSTLSRQLAKQPQPPHSAAQLVARLARAMNYAHDHGVLHRDLKPGNVLLAADDLPKIVDFGLAKNISDDDDDDSRTRTGTILGTPSYMAPEQARGDVKAISPASDQYALGAIFYEMLTGRAPFVSPNPLDTVLQVIEREPIRPGELQPQVPLDAETICLKCLQKDPARRYPSCAALADDLERFLRHEPIVARPIGPVERAVRWCRRNRLVAGLASSVLIATTAVAGVSAWSAYTFRQKNQELGESNRRKDEETRRANDNAAQADAQAQVAIANARQLTDYVKGFFSLVQRLDPEESPRARAYRDRLLRDSIEAMKTVVNQLPKTGEAEPIYAGLQIAIADALAQAERIEEADALYRETGEIFERRMPLKQFSDASRCNRARQLGQLGNLRRDYLRDLDESLALHRRALELSQEVVDESKADDTGKGRVAPFDAKFRLAQAHSNLGATYYRLGDSTLATKHFEQAAALCAPIQAGFEDDADIRARDALEPGFRVLFRVELNSAVNRQTLALAAARYRQDDLAGAEPLFVKAYGQVLAAAKKDPASLGARHALLGIQGFWAEVLAQSGRTAEALPLLEDCARIADELALADPAGATYGRTVALAYYRLAAWRLELGLADDASPLARCLAIRESLAAKDPKNERRQLDLMLALARGGELARADALAVKFRDAAAVDAELLLDVARAEAQISRRTSPENQAPVAARALDALRHAVRLGYRDRTNLERELDFKPLRDQDAFRQLLAELPAPAAPAGP